MSNQPNQNEQPDGKPQRKRKPFNPSPTKKGSEAYKFTTADSAKGGREGGKRASSEAKRAAGRLGGLKSAGKHKPWLKSIEARRRKRQEALMEADKHCEVPEGLPEDLQEQLGIEVNPLREMEKMVLSKETSNADKIKLLTKMVEYTHQKTATKQEIKQEVTSHEGVLAALRESHRLKQDSGFLEYDSEGDVYVAPPPK